MKARLDELVIGELDRVTSSPGHCWNNRWPNTKILVRDANEVNGGHVGDQVTFS